MGAAESQPDPGAVLRLDRVAVRTSEAVWQFDRANLLAANEGGRVLSEVEEFLTAGGLGPMPPTGRVLFSNLEKRAEQRRDIGAACLIVCADAETARRLAINCAR